MKNQNQQLIARQQTQLEKIQKAGNKSPIGFVKSIKNYQKLRAMDNNEARQLVGMIFVKVANLAGIKEPISDINKEDLRGLLFTKYSHLSLEEIDYAFRHDRYSGESISHFQLFNVDYVAKVFKRYADFVMQVKNENHLKVKEPVLEKSVSESEKKTIREEFIKMVFNEMVKDRFSDSAWLLYEDIKPKLSTRKEVLIRLFKIQTMKMQKKKHTNRFNVSAVVGSVENICRSIVSSNYLKKHLTDFETFKKSIQ